MSDLPLRDSSLTPVQRDRRRPLAAAALGALLIAGLVAPTTLDTGVAASPLRSEAVDVLEADAVDSEGARLEEELPQEATTTPEPDGLVTPLAETEASMLELGLSTLAAAPPVTPTDGLILVKTGGDRSTTATRRTINGLAGVALQLYTPLPSGLANMASPVDAPWASCLSDIDGDCYFVVPNAGQGQENYDRRFVVVQTGAPAGWFMNSELKVSTDGSARDQPYQFLTAKVRAQTTVTSGIDFMKDVNTDGEYRSLGTWQSSLNNPKFICRVGLRVALVLDLSGSVRNTLPELKTAATGFIAALEGTGSSVALYTFAANAPSAKDDTGRNYPSVPIDGNMAMIEKRINAYTAGGATNWDSGIYQVAKSSEQYDIALVVTDGMPTYYKMDAQNRVAGNGLDTKMVEVESAIFSANTLKGKVDPGVDGHTGTRMVVVGVGKAINSDPENLAAVSGQTAFDATADNAADADYFQVEWEQIEGALKDIAETAICSANVKVVKQIQRDGSAAIEIGGSGWDFGFGTSVGAVWNQAAAATPLQQTRSTNVEGVTEDFLLFDSSESSSVTVSLDEQMRQAQRDARWSLQSVSCEVNGVAVPPSASTPFGVELTVGVADRVICTFVNVQSESLGLKLVKRGWATDDGARVANPASMDPDVEEIVRGATRPLGSTVTWTYDVSNLGMTLISDIVLVDDRLTSVSCPRAELAPGETMRCVGTGPLFRTN
ncbi:MAG: VWA domain-containing protein [Salinibacterium sp.]|nr:vWA domain-containing protein [Salinibacterium sp.]MBF0671207.1 VWA domain-containing protein [Salinibacterium sp.]